ncbi:M57 family metalloprotease [Aquimarina rhabdastrellae]
MKKIKVLALGALLAGFSISCQKDAVTADNQELTKEVSQEILSKLSSVGVDPTGAKYDVMVLPGGETREVISVSDLNFAVDELKKMADLAVMEDGLNRQYRTTNLVSSSRRTIDILGFTGSGNALTSKMRTALQWAVNNYNRINTTLNFRLTFGTNHTDSSIDMVVYNNNRSGGGGSAGFPTSAGAPHKYIQINAGTDSFNTNVVEHVMTHEIGHSIGLRHTDYFNRNCDGINEGDGGVGAIHIPGTPTGIDSSSIMISCFSGNEDGEFNGNDVTALEYLY